MLSATFKFNNNLSIICSPIYAGVKGCAKYTIMNNKIWYLVPKNGCSTIAWCSEKYNNADITNEKFLAKKIGKEKEVEWSRLVKNGTISVEPIKFDCDMQRIAFYRDPIDRFVSLVNYSYTQTHLEKCDYGSLITDSIESTIRNFVIYCTANNMFKIIDNADQHAVSQYRYIQYLGDKNLTIYHVKDLKAVMEANGIEHEYINETKTKHISRDDIPDYCLEQLKFIYEKDYELEKRCEKNYM